MNFLGSGTSPNIALTLCYHSTKIILSPCAQGILLASAVYGCSTILKCKSTKIFSYLYIIRCIFKTILTEKRFLSCHGRTRTGTGTSPSTTPLSPQRGRGECLPWMRTGTETSPNPSEGGECLPGVLCHGRTRTFFFHEGYSESVRVSPWLKMIGKRDYLAWSY